MEVYLKVGGTRLESSPLDFEQVCGSEEKRAYAQPVLRSYGRLHSLTQGVGSANGDGGQGMMTPKNP